MENLPAEILCHIFNYVDSVNQKRLMLVCSRWKAILHSGPVLSQVMVTLEMNPISPYRSMSSNGCSHLNCKTVARSLKNLLQPTTERLLITRKETHKKVGCQKHQPGWYKVCGLDCRETFWGKGPSSKLSHIKFEGVTIQYTGIVDILSQMPKTVKNIVFKDVTFDDFVFYPDRKFVHHGSRYNISVKALIVNLPVKNTEDARHEMWRALESDGALRAISSTEAKRLRKVLRETVDPVLLEHLAAIVQRLEPDLIEDFCMNLDETALFLGPVTLREMYTAACVDESRLIKQR